MSGIRKPFNNILGETCKLVWGHELFGELVFMTQGGVNIRCVGWVGCFVFYFSSGYSAGGGGKS